MVAGVDENALAETFVGALPAKKRRVRPEQEENAELPMLVTPEPIMMLFSPEQEEKRMLAALLNIPPDPGRAPPGQIRLSTA